MVQSLVCLCLCLFCFVSVRVPIDSVSRGVFRSVRAEVEAEPNYQDQCSPLIEPPHQLCVHSTHAHHLHRAILYRREARAAQQTQTPPDPTRPNPQERSHASLQRLPPTSIRVAFFVTEPSHISPASYQHNAAEMQNRVFESSDVTPIHEFLRQRESGLKRFTSSQHEAIARDLIHSRLWLHVALRVAHPGPREYTHISHQSISIAARVRMRTNGQQTELEAQQQQHQQQRQRFDPHTNALDQHDSHIPSVSLSRSRCLDDPCSGSCISSRQTRASQETRNPTIQQRHMQLMCAHHCLTVPASVRPRRQGEQACASLFKRSRIDPHHRTIVRRDPSTHEQPQILLQHRRHRFEFEIPLWRIDETRQIIVESWIANTESHKRNIDSEQEANSREEALAVDENRAECRAQAAIPIKREQCATPFPQSAQ